MLPGDTVVAMPKDYGRDRLSYSDALEIGREAASEPVPTFPFTRKASE